MRIRQHLSHTPGCLVISSCLFAVVYLVGSPHGRLSGHWYLALGVLLTLVGLGAGEALAQEQLRLEMRREPVDLSALARSRIRTSPGPGAGSGASSWTRTSGPQSAWMRMAFTAECVG